jgi:hypothetical protein
VVVGAAELAVLVGLVLLVVGGVLG